MSPGTSSVAAVFLSVLAGLWFYRLECRQRSATVLATLCWLTLADALLYPNRSDVPVGLLHPGAGALSFRLLDTVVLAALLARLWARGLPRRIGLFSLLWCAWLAWFVWAAVLGLLLGRDLPHLSFEAKAIAYVAVMSLGAGTPARTLVDSRALRGFLVGASALGVLLTVLAGAHRSIGLGIGFLGLAGAKFGSAGGEESTLLVSIGTVALVLALVTGRARLRLLAAAAGCYGTAVVGTQRAALVGAAVSLVAVVGLAAVGRTRLRVTSGELVMVGAGLAALLVLPVFGRLVMATASPLPLQARLSTTFNDRSKVLSGQERVEQLRQAAPLIRANPVFGAGLGTEITFFRVGPGTFYTSDITHNVGVDILLRQGVVGLVLFLLAVGVSMAHGVRAWRRHPDPMVAALAAGTVAVVAGWLAKGVAESVFDEYRLAFLLGLTLGVLRSAILAAEQDGSSAEPNRAAAAADVLDPSLRALPLSGAAL